VTQTSVSHHILCKLQRTGEEQIMNVKTYKEISNNEPKIMKQGVQDRLMK
jgi:hypothetical protein